MSELTESILRDAVLVELRTNHKPLRGTDVVDILTMRFWGNTQNVKYRDPVWFAINQLLLEKTISRLPNDRVLFVIK